MVLGTLSCFTGTLLGSLAAMNIGRYLIRERVERWHQKSRTLRALHKVIELKGTRILGKHRLLTSVVLLRLSPIVPYNILNYVMGVYPITNWEFVKAGFAMLPGVALYVYFGTILTSLSDMKDNNQGTSTLRRVIFICGTLVAVVAIGYVICLTRRTLRKYIEEGERIHAHQEAEQSGVI